MPSEREQISGRSTSGLALPAAAPRGLRVAMIVLNSVSHDARVLKEANSLAQAGHEVTILGMADKRDARARNLLPSGVQVIRVDLQKQIERRRTWLHNARNYKKVMCGFGLAVVAALAWLLARADLGGSLELLGLLAFLGCSLLLLLGMIVLKRPVAFAGSGVESLRARFVEALRLAYHAHLARRIFHAELRQLRPDVVHCHDAQTLPLGCTYRGDCLFVYDSHEIAEHQNMLTADRVAKAIEDQQRYGARLSGLITVNDRIGAFLNETYPRMPPATVIMNATLPEPVAKERDGRLRRAADVPEPTKILLFQGGFARGRGLAALVRAVPLLPEDWVVVLMGCGNFEGPLRELVHALPRRRDAIRFLPMAPQDDLAHWTSGATVGIIPYENTCLNHWFCSPNKLWEYPRAGVPIVASAFPVMRDLVERYEIGWLIGDPDDPASIAATVAAITDADLRSKQANCQSFLQRDNWTHYERRLLDLYAELAAKRAGQRPAWSGPGLERAQAVKQSA